uniref:Ig-like domain-containing protein n=1 Tax=Kryptolebias marmoratus TaxID=37003 RepID=A0A3Q3B0F6_KRYMA
MIGFKVVSKASAIRTETRLSVKKTLLCVASDFYPDHVTLSWETIGGEMLGSVATDSAARRNGMFYKLTSRLRVPAHQWFNPGIEFKCTAITINNFEKGKVEA